MKGFSVDGSDVKKPKKEKKLQEPIGIQENVAGSQWDLKATTSKMPEDWNRWDM